MYVAHKNIKSIEQSPYGQHVIHLNCKQYKHSWAIQINEPFKRRIKSHMLFAGIIRSSPFSSR